MMIVTSILSVIHLFFIPHIYGATYCVAATALGNSSEQNGQNPLPSWSLLSSEENTNKNDKYVVCYMISIVTTDKAEEGEDKMGAEVFRFLIFKIYLFYLFIFGCAGSLLLRAGFL